MKKENNRSIINNGNGSNNDGRMWKQVGFQDSRWRKSYTIGISQFAEHGSLDNCREGFLEGLKEEGIEEGKNLNVEYKNSAADMGTASQIASELCIR